MQFDTRVAKLLQPGQHLVGVGCPGLRLESALEPIASRSAASIMRSDALDLLETHKGRPWHGRNLLARSLVPARSR